MFDSIHHPIVIPMEDPRSPVAHEKEDASDA